MSLIKKKSLLQQTPDFTENINFHTRTTAAPALLDLLGTFRLKKKFFPEHQILISCLAVLLSLTNQFLQAINQLSEIAVLEHGSKNNLVKRVCFLNNFYRGQFGQAASTMGAFPHHRHPTMTSRNRKTTGMKELLYNKNWLIIIISWWRTYTWWLRQIHQVWLPELSVTPEMLYGSCALCLMWTHMLTSDELLKISLTRENSLQRKILKLNNVYLALKTLSGEDLTLMIQNGS